MGGKCHFQICVPADLEPKAENKPKAKYWSGENENEAHQWLMLCRLLQRLLRTTWKSLNVSMLLPSPGQKVKDGADAWVTTGSSLPAPKQSILNPLFSEQRCLPPSSADKPLPHYPFDLIPKAPNTLDLISGCLWGRDWNYPLEQLIQWKWENSPELPPDPLLRQQPPSLFLNSEQFFEKISSSNPNCSPHTPSQFFLMPEHWLCRNLTCTTE